MKTYVILFRAINVGGKNKLPMKELKLLLESEGYSAVQTYIQSGNLVLRSKSNPANTISSLVLSKFGFKPLVLAIEKLDFIKTVNTNPFLSCEGSTVHFYFCVDKPTLNTQKLVSIIGGNEEYQLIDKVFYLHAPDGIGRSKLVSNIESCLGSSATGRNLNTVSKIHELLNADEL